MPLHEKGLLTGGICPFLYKLLKLGVLEFVSNSGMPFWLPQSVQRRLLLYLLQKISILSNIDVPNLDVSLGSSSQFHFKDLDLKVDDIELPDLFLKSGHINDLKVDLTVTGEVELKGDGVLFEVEPTTSYSLSEVSTFSMAKSIQDLTKSVIGITGTYSDDREFEDMIQDTPASADSSSTATPDATLANVPAPSTLGNMKNKLVGSVLGNISFTLENIVFKIIISADSLLELRILKISSNSTYDELRVVDVQGCSLHHVDNTVSTDENLSQSGSLYMSAMEDIQMEPDNNASSRTEVQLLIIDSFTLSLNGIIKVDDFAIKSIGLEVDHIYILLPNIQELRHKQIQETIKIINRYVANTNSPPVKYENYKRFQAEQNIAPKGLEYTFSLQKLHIEVSANISLSLNHIKYYRPVEGVDSFSITSVDLQGQGLSSSHTSMPVLSGSSSSSEPLRISINELCFSLEAEPLRELLSVYSKYNSYLEFLEGQIPKKSKQQNESTPASILLNMAGIHISLLLSDDTIHMDIKRSIYDANIGTVSVEIIDLSFASSESQETLISAQNIETKMSTTPVARDAFDIGFKPSILCSKNVHKIGNMSVRSSRVGLERFNKSLEYLSSMFRKAVSASNKSEVSKTKFVPIAGSLRITNSKQVDYKARLFSRWIAEVGCFEANIENAAGDNTGLFKARISDSVFSKTQEEEFIWFSMKVNCNREFDGQTETLCEVVNSSPLKSPVMYLHASFMDKLKVALKNISFHYYPRWLDGPANSKSHQSSKKDTSVSKTFLVETKCSDCSLFLHAYRLDTGLVVALASLEAKVELPDIKAKISSKKGILMLIDDITNIRSAGVSKLPSLSNFYTKQGFSEIGKIEKLALTITNASALELSLSLPQISLSVCADSLYTLTQFMLDLRPPLEFPDEIKYKKECVIEENVFDNLDMQFFEDIPFLDPGTSVVNAETVHIVESFLDLGGSDIQKGSLDAFESSKSFDYPSKKEGKYEGINIRESYFDEGKSKVELASSKASRFLASLKLRVNIEQIIVKMFDGYDWKYTRKAVSKVIEMVDSEVTRQTVDEDEEKKLEATVFDSIIITATTSDGTALKQKINDQVQGQSSSDKYLQKPNLHPTGYYKSLLKIEGINLLFKSYDTPIEDESSDSDSFAPVSSTKLDITLFEIIDNLPLSTWNKFLTQIPGTVTSTRAPVLSAELETVYPISHLKATETAVKLNIAPLRLHVDQDTLNFIVRFFSFKDARFELKEEYPDIIFLQKFNINKVQLLLDYKPKKVDYAGLRAGKYNELINFVNLDRAQLNLESLTLYGVNGFEELGDVLKSVWTPDIIKNQLPGLIGGISVLKPVTVIGSDLKSLVKTSYANSARRGDTWTGVTGVRNNVYLKTATGDFIKLGAKLATGTQTILENTEGLLGGSGGAERRSPDEVEVPSLDIDLLIKQDQLVGGQNPKIKDHEPAAVVVDSSEGDSLPPKVVSLYADQPLDIHSGLEEAYSSLEKNIRIAFKTVWTAGADPPGGNQNPKAVAVSVAKVAPVAIIRPLIGATEAVSRTLHGLSNQLDKTQQEELASKYKMRHTSR